jgi:hypothetical protein
VRVVRRRLAPSSFLELHAIPLAFLVLLWTMDLRFLGHGGGSPRSWPAVFVRSFSLAVGGPSHGIAAYAIGASCMLGAIVALARVARTGSDSWIFHAVILFVAPLGWLVFPTDLTYERHFLVGLAFLLVLAAGLASSTRARFVLAALFLCASALHVVPFLRHGRGAYADAVRFLRDESIAEGHVSVAGDHDFRNQLVLFFYAERTPGKPLVYHEQGTWSSPAPEWYLAHRQDGDPRPAEALVSVHGDAYRLVRVFPYGGLSGWDWFVYRRAQ